MTIYVPGAMFAAGVCIYLFYEINRAKEVKKDERRESLHDIRQQYLEQLIESKRVTREIADKPSASGVNNEPSENNNVD